MYSSKTLIIIPARIGSTRLARKALAKIGDICMVEHVVSRVRESGLENIFVATDSQEIEEVLAKHKINTIITSENCETGTDRVYEAWKNLENNKDFDYILNVQGDMPFIDPVIIKEVAEHLWKSDSDIVTPVVKVGVEEAQGHSNVKAVADNKNKALYFSREMIPSGGSEFLYHVGVYGYKASALEKFVKLDHSKLENTERLEQLRALEHGMSIEICYVNTIPISVDTKEDLEKAIRYFNKEN